MTALPAIIVEDEINAAKDLSYLLKELNASIIVAAILPSIEETLSWLQQNEAPALGFFDIQLQDGQSFEIFKRAKFSFPVIFTTAYDEYAIDAFKVNSIDYLLKPIHKDALEFSLNKFKELRLNTVSHSKLESILNITGKDKRTSTILVQHREKLIPILIDDFAYFFIENENVYGCTSKNVIHTIDSTMEQLQGTVDPDKFFRANRQFLINRSSIQEMEIFFNGRLIVKLNPSPSDHIVISKARVPLFKKWLQTSVYN